MGLCLGECLCLDRPALPTGHELGGTGVTDSCRSNPWNGTIVPPLTLRQFDTKTCYLSSSPIQPGRQGRRHASRMWLQHTASDPDDGRSTVELPLAGLFVDQSDQFWLDDGQWFFRGCHFATSGNRKQIHFITLTHSLDIRTD